MNTEEAQILVANTSAVFNDGGVMYRIVKGRTTARQGARIVKGREHMWKPLNIDFDVPVKAEPVAKRGPGRPRKSETDVAVQAMAAAAAIPVKNKEANKEESKKE